MTQIGCFIIPRPRTGGTLLASMLNAHSDISFCYEIFPELLFSTDGTPFEANDLYARIERLAGLGPTDLIKALPRDNFRVFVARAHRSGIVPADLLSVLSNFSGATFSDDETRMSFVEALMLRQGRKEAATLVGAKMKAPSDVLIQRYPEATYLMMVRDGRDVFASRRTKGNFSKTPRETAQDWIDGLNHFKQAYVAKAADTQFVKYENLVAFPKEELSKVTRLLSVSFEERMVSYEQSHQELFSNAHGHLSAEQLKSGLNDSSIGKWRSILSPEDVAQFEDIARPQLEEFGYI